MPGSIIKIIKNQVIFGKNIVPISHLSLLSQTCLVFRLAAHVFHLQDYDPCNCCSKTPRLFKAILNLRKLSLYFTMDAKLSVTKILYLVMEMRGQMWSEGTNVYWVISICQTLCKVLYMLSFPHQPHEVCKWGLLSSRSNSRLFIFISGVSASSFKRQEDPQILSRHSWRTDSEVSTRFISWKNGVMSAEHKSVKTQN